MGLGWVGLGWLLPYVMLVQLNVTMELSNVSKKKKKKRTIECDKNTVICDIGTDQCDDGTIKYEKKIRVPSNVTKVQ